MDQPNFRQLCSELTECLTRSCGSTFRSAADLREFQSLVDRARSALAQPEPKGLTDQELAQIALSAVRSNGLSELPYFLDSDSDEYEPMIAALRAVIAADRTQRGDQPTSQEH